MPVALDIQTNGWEDTRGEGGRILTRDVGDYIVIPWRNLQFFGSTTGTGTGTSYQAGGFNESWTGYGSALLISVGDDSAGSGIAVRMLVFAEDRAFVGKATRGGTVVDVRIAGNKHSRPIREGFFDVVAC